MFGLLIPIPNAIVATITCMSSFINSSWFFVRSWSISPAWYGLTEILSLMQSLPMLYVVEQEEFFLFIEHNTLMGTGLGFVDVHLLAATKLAEIPLWTLDKKFKQVCSRLSIDFST